MPLNKYDIQISATLSWGEEVSAETVEQAIERAKTNLRTAGTLGPIDVERAVYLDPNPDSEGW